MILCSPDCIPCCDFCIHAIHWTEEINGKTIKMGVSGCGLHADKEHQDYAVSCYYCDDYHCFNANQVEVTTRNGRVIF